MAKHIKPADEEFAESQDAETLVHPAEPVYVARSGRYRFVREL
ncbi:hypothetical protein [Herbidospora sp. RD11066]